jgi:D-alanyl-D-alanine carboxypeptidase
MRSSVTQAIAVSLALTVPGLWTASADDADDYVEAEMKVQRIPGLSLAVIKDGTLIKATGHGLANLEVSAGATAETIYELGSVTKQFTATAIMMLVNEKKLILDDRLSRYLPDVPQAWEGVTIRHLLNHTSGIANHAEMKVIMDDEGKEYTRAQMLGLIANAPVKFKPGEEWAYNDSGYFLLAQVVETASGQPYEQFLTERIFKPLEMTVTRSTVLDEVVQHRASGYIWRDGQFRRGHPVSPTQSLGGGHLRSSVQDLAKWDAALRGEKLLPRHLLDEMWTPGKLNNGRAVPSYLTDLKDSSYGFGWLLGELRGHRFVEHGGSISSGYTSDILRFLDDGLTVIILTNRSVSLAEANYFAPDAPRPWDIAKGVVKYYIPDLRRPANVPSN